MARIYFYDQAPIKRYLVIAGLFACFGIGCFLYTLSQRSPGLFDVVFALGPSLGIAIWAVRFHLRTPFEVNLLDGDLIQIRDRQSAQTFRADEMQRIRLSLSPDPTSWLSVKTMSRTWQLPCSEAQGEDLIRKLTKLNPTVLVQR